ncbi:MAG: methionine aminotransferase [Gammaproteobacteria bacterium]
MSQLALDHDAVNLSQGFPDFDGPPELLDRVSHYLHGGHNQYAPMAGVPGLREALARKVRDLYGAKADPDTEITVTSGATEALFCAISAVISSGDEAIVFDPAYDSYDPAITLNGGRAVHLPLGAPNFRIDWDRVEDALCDKTRAIILNSPHNPTGSVLDRRDIDALISLAERHPFFLISDEVYEHIIFDGLAHESLARYENLMARSFVISSFGKTYHTTGWKIGYCVAPKALSDEFRRIHQFVTFCSNTPVQLALADFLAAHPGHHRALPDFYQQKRDLFCSLIESSRFRFTPSSGTYFQLLDYSEVSNLDDVTLARELTVNERLATIPVSVFYENPPAQKMLRLCFCKDDRTLARGAEILCRL